MTSNPSSLIGMIVGVLLLVGCASPPPDSNALPSSSSSPRVAASATTASNLSGANVATVTPASAEPLASPQPVGSASPSTGKPVDAARPTSPQASTATDEDAYTGFYEVAGALPADMKPFGNFMIRSVASGKVSGAVVPDEEGEVFEFTNATLANGKLSFTTAKNAGVSYSFEGAFTATPPFGGGKKTPVVEGVLKKYRNAQAAGQADLKFYYDAGGGE